KSNADARARLNALWDDLTLETPPFWTHAAQRDLAYFGLPGFYVPRPDFWTAPSWTYVYDTRPLLVTLGRHVDFAALNASPTALAGTAGGGGAGALGACGREPRGGMGGARGGRGAPPGRRRGRARTGGRRDVAGARRRAV